MIFLVSHIIFALSSLCTLLCDIPVAVFGLMVCSVRFLAPRLLFLFLFLFLSLCPLGRMGICYDDSERNGHGNTPLEKKEHVDVIDCKWLIWVPFHQLRSWSGSGLPT